MTSSNNIIFILLSSVFAIASCQEQQQLQQVAATAAVNDDPCLGQEQDVLFPNLLSIGVHFYKSSFVERCYESLSINTTNTLQNILKHLIRSFVIHSEYRYNI